VNGVNVRVVGTKIVVEAEILQAIAGGMGDIKTGSRSGPSGDSGLLGRINARRRAAICLRTECASRVPGQRPLRGDVPTIDLVVGYSRTNTSPILKLLLSRIDDLIARESKNTH
jgi:hypothetical protein